jgi:hypothetical protein
MVKMNNPITQSLDIGKDLESNEGDDNMAKKEKKEAKKEKEEDEDFDFDDDEDTEPRPLTSYLGWLLILGVILLVCLWLFTSWRICVQF